jgi:hypothetical protein
MEVNFICVFYPGSKRYIGAGTASTTVQRVFRKDYYSYYANEECDSIPSDVLFEMKWDPKIGSRSDITVAVKKEW